MRLQLTVFWIALLCATVASAAQPAGQPAPLDRVLGQLHDSRAARASNPKQGKISSRLLPPPTVGPSTGGLVAAPPPLAADGSLHVYLDCSPLGSAELQKLQQAGVRIERIEMARGRVQARVDASALETLAGFSWVRAVRSVDRAVVRAGSVTTEGDAAAGPTCCAPRASTAAAWSSASSPTASTACGTRRPTNDLPDVGVPNAAAARRAQRRRRHRAARDRARRRAGREAAVQRAGEQPRDGRRGRVPDRRRRRRDRRRPGVLRRAVLRGRPRGRSRARRRDRPGVSYHSSAGNEAAGAPRAGLLPRPGLDGCTTSRPARGDNIRRRSSCRRAGRSPASCSGTIPSAGRPTTTTSFCSTPNLNLVAESIDPQDGAQDPIELVAVVNQTNTDALANVLIKRFAGERAPARAVLPGRGALEHGTAAGSIFGHAALTSVVAVGAVDVRRSRPRRGRGVQLARTGSRRLPERSRSAPSRISSRSTASRSRTPVASRPARPSAPSSARRPPRRIRRVSPRCSSTRTRR